MDSYSDVLVNKRIVRYTPMNLFEPVKCPEFRSTKVQSTFLPHRQDVLRDRKNRNIVGEYRGGM